MRAVDLARRAQHEPRLSTQVRTLALQQEARGHIVTEDARSCWSALARASAISLPASADQGVKYRIGQYSDGNRQVFQHAAVLLDLGYHRDAMAWYRQNASALAGMYVWERSVHTAKLAYAYAQAGEVEHAATLASQALALGEGTGFASALAELRKLSAWNYVPAIARTTDQLSTLKLRILGASP